MMNSPVKNKPKDTTNNLEGQTPNWGMKANDRRITNGDAALMPTCGIPLNIIKKYPSLFCQTILTRCNVLLQSSRRLVYSLNKLVRRIIKKMMSILLTWGAIFIPIAIALSIAGATFGGSLLWLYEIFAAFCLYLGLNFMLKAHKRARNYDAISEKTMKLLDELPDKISTAIEKALKGETAAMRRNAAYMRRPIRRHTARPMRRIIKPPHKHIA